MRLNTSIWLLPCVAGLVEGAACFAIMETPSPDSPMIKALSLAFVVGGAGSVSLLMGWFLYARLSPGGAPRFRPLPILILGMITMPVLWFWMAITRPWFAEWGTPGFSFSAGLDTALTAAVLVPAYAWAVRSRVHWLTIQYWNQGKKNALVTVPKIHFSWVTGAIAYETLFVFLQTVANPYLHTLVTGPSAWFAIGFVSASFGMMIQRITSKLQVKLQA